MAVEVRLFTTLREFLPPESIDGVYQYQMEGEKTIKELAAELKLPFPHIHLIMINGEQGNLDSTFRDGDRVGFFPPVGGG
ncbi:MAG: MoaD/ThiS family protein [Bacillota bacterium]|nr:MoaD/ThiS family protein [Bacillota bacterium]